MEKTQTDGGGARRSASGHDLGPLSAAERERLAAGLSPEERRILLEHGTEPAFCGTLLNNKQAGAYVCRLCGLPLFRSGAKFESGTGWPSFVEPIDGEHIREVRDTSYGMVRTEVRCRRCDGHLGHVFPDGPPPTHQRYCLNSASLQFVAEAAPAAERPSAATERH
jgi:peptide-methionine (R)-S-oxide reductase